jgi:hypothetical protein
LSYKTTEFSTQLIIHMKKTIVVILGMSISNLVFSQVPNHHWTKSINGGSSASGKCITTDEFGNVYTAGVFGSTSDFDPSAGVSNLISNGGLDVYLVKTNPQGDFIWAKNFGGSNDDIPSEIVISATGNVYLTGIFEGTADFNPEAAVSSLTSIGQQDVFVLKVNSNGQYLWAKSIGSTNNDEGNGIDIDDFNESVFVIGTFSLTIDLDPGAGTQNTTSLGSTDVFMLKLNASGDYVTSKTAGSISADRGEDIIINETTGDQYMTGFVGGTADFDPGVAVVEVIGSNDIFLWKLSEANNLVYAKKMGGIAVDEGRNIDLDASGNVYINGSFISTCNFDPNGGTLNITSNGSDDVFVAKLTASGNLTWVKTFGSIGTEDFMDMDVTSFGDVYVTGEMADDMDANPDAVLTANLIKNGTEDAYIVSLDSDGTFNWATNYGASSIGSYTRGFGIFADEFDNVFTTGYYQGTVDFDPSGASTSYTSISGSDIWFQKLGPGFNGLNEEINLNEVQLFPNPSNGKCSLTSSKGFNEAILTVTDLNGKEVYSRKQISAPTIELDLSYLKNGSYLISIQENTSISIKRFVKND